MIPLFSIVNFVPFIVIIPREANGFIFSFSCKEG